MRTLTVLATLLPLLAACSDDGSQMLEPDGSQDYRLLHDGAATPDQDERDGGIPDGVKDGPPVTKDSGPPDLGKPDAPVTRVAGHPVELKGLASNPGNLAMWQVVPTHMPAKAPLVVVLHACNNQNVRNYNLATGWGTLAAKHGFYVLYPQTNTTNNIQACFNWFDSSDNKRGKGEAASIKAGVDAMIAAHDIDPKRVYVEGFSAGAAMATALLAVYPEVFAGGGIIAGVPYGCATGVFSAFSCMSGVDKTPATWASKVKDAATHTGDYPKVAILHGTLDGQVGFDNFNELIEQWTAVHGTDQKADHSSTVGNAKVTVYRAKSKDVVAGYEITGGGHSYPQRNPSAPEQLVTFWGL